MRDTIGRIICIGMLISCFALFCHMIYECFWWLVNNRQNFTLKHLKGKYTKDKIKTEVKTLYNRIELIVSLAYAFLPSLTIYHLNELSIISSFWNIAAIVFDFIIIFLIIADTQYWFIICTILNVISTYCAYTLLDLRSFLPYIIFWTISIIISIQMFISDDNQ